MRVQDVVNLRGEVLITGIDSITKNETIFVDDKNLIVLNGRKKLADLLLIGTGSHIGSIVLGSGGTPVNNPSLPYAVDPTELTVKTPLVAGVSDTSTFIIDSSASPKLSFSLLIPESSYNGKGINELALMLTDGNLANDTAFAIKRFATIVKSESLALKIVWTIYL